MKTRNGPHALFQELRYRRETLRLRQIDLAEITGYNEADINRWENGREIPRGSALLNWCQALGAPLNLAVRSGKQGDQS